MDRLRTALVGFGMSGQTFHAPLVTATPELELTTIVTADDQRGALARARYPRAAVAERTEDLYRGTPPDLVVVATPNDAHHAVAMEAIEQGCAVVIDKPMTLSSEEGRELVDAAQNRRVVLTVFQNRRWDADHLTLLRLVRDATLGQVWRYHARYEFYRPGPAPARTNGLLLGLGSHTIDQALQLFGPAKHVYAEVCTRVGDKDDDSFVAITHASGVLSHCSQSSRSQLLGPRLRVVGSEATFEVESVDRQQGLLEEAGALPPLGEPTEPEANHPMLVRGGVATRIIPEPGRWAAFYPAVARAVIEKTPPPVDPAEAVAALVVMEAARRSSDTASVVSL